MRGGIVLFSNISAAQQVHLCYVLGRGLASVVWFGGVLISRRLLFF